MPKVGFQFPPESIERLRVSHLGQRAWNKGRKLCNHDPQFYRRSPSGSPFCLICKRANAGKYRKKNQKEINAKGRLARYRLTKADFNVLWIKQSGLCAICSEPLDLHKYRIDHNHITGEVRGLLCASCNTAIGLFKDSIKSLIQAVRYLDGNNTN